MTSHDLQLQQGDPALIAGANPQTGLIVPGIIADDGDRATRRFIEFFTANIRNANTRAAYGRAAAGFFAWCEANRLCRLEDIQPTHIAVFIEEQTHLRPAPTVKQHLAAIRALFDWLVTGGVLPFNPAHAVRGPSHKVKRGKTPVLSVDEARQLLNSIPTDTVTGLRDRALIGVMIYSFARVSAALSMRVEDYYPAGKRWWLRLHEKGGKFHEIPAHHSLEDYLDAYINAACITSDKKGWLFRSVPWRNGPLTAEPVKRRMALDMVKRRARQAGIATPISCHSFRATGITAYRENGGTLENAQMMAAHESPRTTQLYDRTNDQVTLDEVERIGI